MHNLHATAGIAVSTGYVGTLGWTYNMHVAVRACTEKNQVLKKIGFIYF